MSSTLEQYLAVDVGVLVSGAAACSHSAATHQPLHICSVTMQALEGFVPVAAENLKILPVTVVTHHDDDYDLTRSIHQGRAGRMAAGVGRA